MSKLTKRVHFKGAFPLMRFLSGAAAVQLGTFITTMHFQRSVSIDAVSRTARAARLAEQHAERFFPSNRTVRGATVAKGFSIYVFL